VLVRPTTFWQRICPSPCSSAPPLWARTRLVSHLGEGPEEALIQNALEDAHGNYTDAARLLGVIPTTCTGSSETLT